MIISIIALIAKRLRHGMNICIGVSSLYFRILTYLEDLYEVPSASSNEFSQEPLKPAQVISCSRKPLNPVCVKSAVN